MTDPSHNADGPVGKAERVAMIVQRVLDSLKGMSTVLVNWLPGMTRHEELQFRDVISWFVQRKKVKNGDESIVAFTWLLRPEMAGDARVGPEFAWVKKSTAPVMMIQGFYDVRNEKLLEARVMEGGQMDPDLVEAHSAKPVVIYE